MKSVKSLVVIALLILALASSLVAQTGPSRERIIEQDLSGYEVALQAMADGLLSRYFDGMPRMRILITAHRNFEERKTALAFYAPDIDGKPAILIKPEYFRNASFMDVVDTVKHELTHVWVKWKGLYTDEFGGHNEAFLRKAIEIGLPSFEDGLHFYPEARALYKKLLIESVNPQAKNSGQKKIDPDVYTFNFLSAETGNAEVIVIKVSSPLTVGTIYHWRDRAWRVVRIDGSDVLLKEGR